MGLKLTSRYQIFDYLDEGSHGQIYTVSDTQNPSGDKLVVKMVKDKELFQHEVLALEMLNKVHDKLQSSNKLRQEISNIFPKIVDKGEINNGSFVSNYFVMPKLDVNMYTYLEQFTGVQRSIQVLQIISQVIDILEIVHLSCLVYNDLKPDNIMVNRSTQKVTLIDFGFASSFINADGSHISDSEMNETFHGNLLYASFDQMNFFRTCRKDDIIAVFYILMEQLNKGSFIGKPKDLELLTQNKDDVEHQFAAFRNYKEKYTLKNIVKYATKNHLLNPFDDQDISPYAEVSIKLQHSLFMDQIEKFAYQAGKTSFDEKPSYSKLRRVIKHCTEILQNMELLVKKQHSKAELEILK